MSDIYDDPFGRFPTAEDQEEYEAAVAMMGHDEHCDVRDVDPAIGRATKPCNCGKIAAEEETV